MKINKEHEKWISLIARRRLSSDSYQYIDENGMAAIQYLIAWRKSLRDDKKRLNKLERMAVSEPSFWRNMNKKISLCPDAMKPKSLVEGRDLREAVDKAVLK